MKLRISWTKFVDSRFVKKHAMNSILVGVMTGNKQGKILLWPSKNFLFAEISGKIYRVSHIELYKVNRLRQIDRLIFFLLWFCTFNSSYLFSEQLWNISSCCYKELGVYIEFRFLLKSRVFSRAGSRITRDFCCLNHKVQF